MTVWICVTKMTTVLQFYTVLPSLIVFCSQLHLSVVEIQLWKATHCTKRKQDAPHTKKYSDAIIRIVTPCTVRGQVPDAPPSK